MPHDPDPDSLRVHFGLELRRMRTRADLSMSGLAKALGCTPQWISQLEQSDKPVPEQSAFDLDTFFRTDGWEENDGVFHRMYIAIRRAGRRRALLPGFEAYVKQEGQAVFIRGYAAQVVPGLLQTPSYAIGVMNPDDPAETLEARVAGRMDRQAILLRDRPPRSHFVLDESVLHRPIGGSKAMGEQLDQLIGFATSPQVQVRILPYTAVIPAGLDGAFMLLGFEKNSDLVYSEAPGVSQLVDDKNIVTECAVRFDLLMGEALSRAESTAMITRAREGYL